MFTGRFIQTEKEFANEEIVKGVTIKDFGCLLVTLTNIINQKGSFGFFKPDEMVRYLRGFNGFNERGEIIWEALKKAFGLNHKRYIYANRPIFNVNNYYIVQVPFRNTGHFCEILDFDTNNIRYFDTYDGKVKNTNTYITIREISFDI